MYFINLKAVLFLSLFSFTALSQDFSIDKIEPPNWWVGMKWDTVQLMVYGANLEGVRVSSSNIELKILNVQSPDNSNYVFVDIFIPEDLKSGNYKLKYYKDDVETEIEYPILEREMSADKHLGFSNEDVIYLVFADRFCDGNPKLAGVLFANYKSILLVFFLFVVYVVNRK